MDRNEGDVGPSSTSEPPTDSEGRAGAPGAGEHAMGAGERPAASGPGAGAPEESEPLMDSRTRRAVGTLLATVRKFFGRTLDLQRDANIQGTIETIHKDMVFQGPNVWVLVCSIFIASIGLNVNSAAVIIGAMLISPLMGPILGIGLTVGVNDLPNLRRAVRYFVIMTAVAVVTSTLYFLITPLDTAQPELLARTRPTLLDAAIALFGGVAGIVGVSRRDRGNVIPGVAIATALMPPLCTAGYGLANGNWAYFFGAFYLFALNSVFIAIATVAVVRYLHFPFVEFMDDAARRRTRLRIAAFVFVVIIPSAWVLFGVVKESLFLRRASDFVAQNLGTIPGVDIVNQRFVYSDTLSVIEVFLTGSALPAGVRQQMETRMAAAGLRNTTLRLHEPQDLVGEMGRLSSELRVGIVQDLYERQARILEERELRIRELESVLAAATRDTIPVEQITREVGVQHPGMEGLSFGKLVLARETRDSTGIVLGYAMDTIPTVLVRWRAGTPRQMRTEEEGRLSAWLKVRLGLDTIQVIGN